MLQFKQTHTAKAYSLQDFRKSVGGQCTVDCIEYLDEDGNPQIIDCYFENGANKEEIRELLSGHTAFQNATKLETLALKYKVNVIFCPRYHCELNAIEGLWCS
ncbi:unnamed protein product [Adineta ricciae]|uniref:Tc1-like transposase DDE domain-containing protein n=1 Tax=Adineta ricciae TaxID=249248 RepID=A0A815LA16_ADIRI|nr:unnamed protein product [Adineta ricciae]